MYTVSQEELLELVKEFISPLQRLLLKREIKKITKNTSISYKYAINYSTVLKPNKNVVTLIPPKITITEINMVNSIPVVLRTHIFYIPISVKNRNKIMNDSGYKLMRYKWECTSKSKTFSKDKIIYKTAIEVG